MINDYYYILGVDRDADLETIKNVFRKKIALYHPENNKAPEAKEKFDLLIEAFNVLSDKNKRKAYDKMLNDKAHNLPQVVTPKQEETYKEWQKEAKKKSKTSWESDLTDLLLLDVFFNLGFTGIFDDIGDVIGDTFGDVFDLF